jgi:hypothetical protein
LTALHLAPDLTTKPGNTFQATFTDKVVKMEQRVFLDSIRSVSSDNTTFVFDPSDSTASQLKQGSILFVPGIAMRKVDVATKQDGRLVVVTEDATPNASRPRTRGSGPPLQPAAGSSSRHRVRRFQP